MIDQQLFEFVKLWGPAVLILLGLFLLSKKGLGKFIELWSKHTERISEQTEVLRGLGTTISGISTKNEIEHREMIILLKVIAERIDTMEERRRGYTERAV